MEPSVPNGCGHKTKIGIVTILKVNNYGAELQAYATQAILKKLGWDAEIIDYLFYKNPDFKKTRRSKPLFPMGLTKKAKEFLYPILANIKSKKDSEASRLRKSRFDEFHRQNTSLSRTYRTIDDLYSDSTNYDVYMVGSDQVWNPGIYSSIEPYFLTFAPKGKKRISYASSFGVSEIPLAAQPFYKNCLNQMDAVSVRENNAVAMIDSLCGKKAHWVLDPTLLLTADDWKQVASMRYEGKKDFVLIYELTPCPYLVALAKHIAHKLGLTMVRICKNAAVEDKEALVENVTDAGPAEFLELFEKAAYVVTNSFHGTAFSVNFGKPFYTVAPKRKDNNSRQQSLLGMLALEDRLVLEDSPFPALEKGIDYEKVNALLNEQRDKSVDFLRKAIDGK